MKYSSTVQTMYQLMINHLKSNGTTSLKAYNDVDVKQMSTEHGLDSCFKFCSMKKILNSAKFASNETASAARMILAMGMAVFTLRTIDTPTVNVLTTGICYPYMFVPLTFYFLIILALYCIKRFSTNTMVHVDTRNFKLY